MLLSPDRASWPVISLSVSALMLAIAHGFERFLLLAPCPLCYTQRQVYWAVIAISVVTITARATGARGRMIAGLCLLIGLTFTAGAGIAGYHALVEWGFLPAPATCATGGGVSIEGDLWSELSRPQAIPSCAEALWRFLGLSMAGWNALASSALAVASFWVALRRPLADADGKTGQPEAAGR
jgi:disulfide bond formation protein DsbB